MKIARYIILNFFIVSALFTNVYSKNINDRLYFEQKNNNYEVIYADVGNHNRRSSSRSSSSSSNIKRRNSTARSRKYSILEILPGFLFMFFIFIVQNFIFNKEKKFLHHKKNIKKNILKIDSNFSKAEFLDYAEKLFLKLNDLWTKRDWEYMRDFESSELFEKHNNQINEYINNGTINCIENITIKNIFISDFYNDNNYIYLTVKINSKLIDYIINVSDGKVIEGSKGKYWRMGYTMTFRKNTELNNDNWILCDFKGINL